MVPESYRWVMREGGAEAADRIRQELDCHPLLAKLLASRGVENGREAYRFLNPSAAQLHDPFLMKGMHEAVERICQAISRKERITIYGDYDVDGITATSILFLFLDSVWNVSGCSSEMADSLTDYYLPDRMEEGYGLNEQAICKIAQSGTKLIITVDTGISALRECDLARKLGMDVIVTDHHECPSLLPRCISVIDAKQPGETYPYRHLAGCGVSFKLVQALAQRLEWKEDILPYLELAAVGTIADIVELTGENRILVSEGFRRMKDPSNLGLRELLRSAGYDFSRKLTSGFIGFGAAPRLNAGGRMGDASRGVKLFTTRDPEEAREIACQLDEENESRRQVEQEILEQVRTIIDGSEELKNSKVIVVCGQGWHHGVIGIVSSRIKDAYYRPNIILSADENGLAAGSARSIPGFDLYAALTSCSDLFVKYGGHAAAAGMTLPVTKVPELIRRLNAYADEKMDAGLLTPVLEAEAQIEVSQIDTELIRQIEKMEPFGQGMPRPLVQVSGVIEEIRPIGADQQTLRVRMRGETMQQRELSYGYNARVPVLSGVAFRGAAFASYYSEGMDVSMIGSLELNRYMGRETPQLLISDIHGKMSDELRSLCLFFALRHVDTSFAAYSSKMPLLDPKVCSQTYRFLRSKAVRRPAGTWNKEREMGTGVRTGTRSSSRYKETGTDQEEVLQGRISLESFTEEERLYAALQSIAVFEELGLTTIECSGPYLAYILIEGRNVLLKDSAIFREHFLT